MEPIDMNAPLDWVKRLKLQPVHRWNDSNSVFVSNQFFLPLRQLEIQNSDGLDYVTIDEKTRQFLLAVEHELCKHVGTIMKEFSNEYCCCQSSEYVEGVRGSSLNPLHYDPSRMIKKFDTKNFLSMSNKKGKREKDPHHLVQLKTKMIVNINLTFAICLLGHSWFLGLKPCDITIVSEPAEIDRPGKKFGTECVCCSENDSTYAIVPCGHLCLCDSCVHEYRANTCPICRTNVNRKMKIFI